MSEPRRPLMTNRLERALRRCALWHVAQTRKGSPVPYVEHVFGVAMILDRLGYAEEVVLTGLLHDVLEDVEGVTEAMLAAEFGPRVAAWVAACSERKTDANGVKRPWLDRKTEYLAGLEDAPEEARAVALADKLHNLTSILVDLEDGQPVWSLFNAGPRDVFWYYDSALARLGHGAGRMAILVEECRRVLDDVRRRTEEAGATA